MTKDTDAGIVLRNGSNEDAVTISRLIAELAEAMGETAQVNTAYIRECLSFPGSGIVLAEHDGEVVGMLSYSIRPNLYHASPCCTVEELVVRQAYRRRSVGKKLLEWIVAHAREQSCVEISLSVLPGNQPALDFYRSMGFDDEAVLMELHIQDSSK